MLLGIPATLLHELGHILAAAMCGVKVKKVGLSRVGLYTVREPGPRWANLCVSLAGPLFNLLLAATLREVAPTFAWVNLMACAYNLLPIPNSDGRRILALLAPERVVATAEMPPARLQNRLV
ncbi:MAG TPA: M50 family metallopeptidase [Bryocella sp.]|nr:M50 family metallopeptidase [Bryocella sp.]